MKRIRRGQKEMEKEIFYEELDQIYYPRFRNLAQKHLEELFDLCKKVRNLGKNKFGLDEKAINREVILPLIHDWQEYLERVGENKRVKSKRDLT